MTNRELDAAIAEALGWTNIELIHEHEDAGDIRGYDVLVGVNPDDGEEDYVPLPTTDPVAADALMRALRERGMLLTVRWGYGDPYAVVGGTHTARADTWTLALAKAALSALTAGKP